MSSSKTINYLKLKELISKDIIFLLPHKKYKGIRQTIVYARCGISRKYFEKAYKNGDVILQFGQLGPRVGHPLSWEEALNEFLKGEGVENGAE